MSALTAAPLVVLIGRPNSGKSSLYNAVAGGDARVGQFARFIYNVDECLCIERLSKFGWDREQNSLWRACHRSGEACRRCGDMLFYRNTFAPAI